VSVTTSAVPKPDEVYDPAARIPDPETAQRRLDEIWTRIVNVVSLGGVVFLLRSDVSDDHTLVGVQPYRVAVPRPTHASLESALFPSFGALVLKDAGVGALLKPRAVLPIETPRVLEWTKDGCVVWARLLYFEYDMKPKIFVAREVLK
jgi:hypothetical protein